MSNMYGNIADSNTNDSHLDSNTEEVNKKHKLRLDVSDFSSLRFDEKQNYISLQNYLDSSDGQAIAKEQEGPNSTNDILFSPSSTSSQRNVVTPTLKFEHHDGWQDMLAPSYVNVDEFKEYSSQQEKRYLTAISTKQHNDIGLDYASSVYHTPNLYPNDAAVSPSMSYLTTGDDEVDDLLSVHSGTSVNSNFSLPLNSSGYKHVTNIDELDNLLTVAHNHFDAEFNNIMQNPSPNDLQIQQQSAQPPVISIQEFQEQELENFHIPFSSPTLDTPPFQPTHHQEQQQFQQMNSSLLHPTENLSEISYEEMRNGRIARRRASHSSRTSSRSSIRSRSISPDEKARSLSEDSARLLDLADLQHTPPIENIHHHSSKSLSPLDDGETFQNLSGNTKKKLSRKNPATYACELCDKCFTRPYNLKSHLRTHTNERPFVCSICGKAFARQHDRKRHEDLHTGKKRYVCGGKLKEGTPWGCGKKFARSDALGRHFKTESGRKCIAPLYEEASKDKSVLKL